MIALQDCVTYCDDLLKANAFKDYCPNGLQVMGKDTIHKIVSGVTASLALIDAAISANADVILVHHGLFWNGDSYALTGQKYERIRHLMVHNIGVIAYHLPLDAHPVYGNNAQLSNVLGLEVKNIFDISPNLPLGYISELNTPILASDFKKHIEASLNRSPLHIEAGSSEVKRIAWCSGAAQKYIDIAHAQGADAYLSGEISESTTHTARELGINYYACGHHATERYGVKALGEHLAKHFGLDHEFIDIDNPV